jgi:hypothetical protein
MQAKSIKGNSTAAISTALQQCMADGFIPTLAIVFISVKQDSNAICQVITAAGIDCIGATSCNEFTDGTQTEGAIAILLLNADKSNYAVLTEDIGERTIAEAASHLSSTALQKFSAPSLILLSTSLMHTGAMLDGETVV